mmetsp:Transcript_135508/g.377390  ORF Transcript_135508/g.377390 Transcript_135508/m.377390 type:complete len:210 (+) Transcript_135508:662-1291(+)
MLQEALHDVIPVRVARDHHDVSQQHLHEVTYLGRQAVLHQALDDAAAVLVTGRPGDGAAPLRQLVDDELRCSGPQCLDALLDHVVCMRAPQCLQDLTLELGRQKEARVVVCCVLKSALHLPTTNWVARQCPHPTCDGAAGTAPAGPALGWQSRRLPPTPRHSGPAAEAIAAGACVRRRMAAVPWPKQVAATFVGWNHESDNFVQRLTWP